MSGPRSLLKKAGALLKNVGARAKAAPPAKAVPMPTGKKAVAAKAPVALKGALAAKAPALAPAGKPLLPQKVAKTKAPRKSAVPSAAAAAVEALGRTRRGARPLVNSHAGDGDTVCREVACEGLATSAGYCRLHYIKNWKKIKRKELILKEGKLNQYIEELVAKYPDKYIEAIRQDLANDKDFAKVIYDLDLDEGVEDFDVEGESIDAVIGDIKRDFEDEGEGGGQF